jgi:hypothetical protein
VKIGIIVLFFIVSCTASARADGYNEATEAAYCMGVYRNDLKELKVGNRTRFKADNIADVDQKLFRKQTFVEDAIKQGPIDGDIASKITSVGYAEAQLCSKTQKQCDDEWRERAAKQVGNEQNNKELENCNKRVEPVCDHAYKKCD